MPSLFEDPWVNQQAVNHDVSELADCSIAIDATYYLQVFLDTAPYHEPLLTALGGMTGIKGHLEKDLDEWIAHGVTPFFIFDGQSITGQDEVSITQGLKGIEKTEHAWHLYFNGQANQAVSAFGVHFGAFRPQALYPLLQTLLKKRNLFFLVPPYNAAAQIAYFDMIDSDQCAGIMGSQELLLYPIKDSVIRSIDWEKRVVTAISKKQIIKSLNVSEAMFIDALLMTGTTFLPPFPPLQDSTVNPRQPTVMDAINMLRTSDKSITNACASFSDILQAQDPTWLDKFRKARMAINHFIYIAEDGDVKVHDYDRLTGDNHEYLGFHLPAELFHYLNTGLIGPRALNWITHSKITVLPSIDGAATEEYKTLVSRQLVPIKETALGLLIPRLHRGIQHRDVTMKVWYDNKFTYTVDHRNIQPLQRASAWTINEAAIKSHFPQAASGSITFELSAVGNADFLKTTLSKERTKVPIESADAIVSVVIWRLLYLRGYLNDAHELTSWGSALSKVFATLEPIVKKNPEVSGLYETALVAFELLRFGVLNAKNKHGELHGLPMNGTEDDKNSLLLISRCASLLKLRHQSNGYTGPLSKNLLSFRSLASAVREADRELTEAIVASLFMYGLAKRDRNDGWEIGHRLPFLNDPDVAMGIAVKTLLDEVPAVETAEARSTRMAEFPERYVPYATNFYEDLDISFDFFNALHEGVKALGSEVPASDKVAWDKASKYLQLRR